MNFQYLKDHDLAAQISARICHDLISPIGAIRNGLELLELSGISTSAEFGLVADSVETANARIDFFRLAFGRSDQSRYETVKLRQILRAYYNDSRRSVIWHPTHDLTRDEIKPIFLALLCFEDVMPRGGQIEIHHNSDITNLTGKSDSLSQDPKQWELNSAPSLLGAAQVHRVLLKLELDRQGLALEVDADATICSVNLARSNPI